MTRREWEDLSDDELYARLVQRSPDNPGGAALAVQHRDDPNVAAVIDSALE